MHEKTGKLKKEFWRFKPQFSSWRHTDGLYVDSRNDLLL